MSEKIVIHVERVIAEHGDSRRVCEQYTVGFDENSDVKFSRVTTIAKEKRGGEWETVANLFDHGYTNIPIEDFPEEIKTQLQIRLRAADETVQEAAKILQ